MTGVLVVPDGTGLRNFLYSPFLDQFSAADRIVVWHALPESILPDRRPGAATVTYDPLPPHREGLTERVLRQAKVYGQLYWRQESGTPLMLRYLRRTTRPLNAAIGVAARGVGHMAAMSASALAGLDRLHATISGRARRVKAFEDHLRTVRPDIVFCTHQRASRAVPVMLAARRLGIPSATFIYSWDNLPKGRMAVHADHFLVWSEHMKRELLGYYPEVAPGRVHVVGTPQFEAYFDPSLIQPRESFLGALGLDPKKPVVCFSGDDLSSSPHDPVYLEDLAAALGELPASGRPQIVFRRCPVDLSGRYQEVLDRHPEIAISEPLWRSETGHDWTGVAPTSADAALLANLARHSDLVVNFGSTMAMDFAMLGKPGIFLAYEPVPPPAGAMWTARESYELPHLQGIIDLQPVHWVRARGDMASVVMHALEHPDETAEARARWIDRLVQRPLDQASSRIYQALRSISRPYAA